MTSLDEEMIMLHKFDSNSEHTILPCRSLLAIFSKLYLILTEHLTYVYRCYMHIQDPKGTEVGEKICSVSWPPKR